MGGSQIVKVEFHTRLNQVNIYYSNGDIRLVLHGSSELVPEPESYSSVGYQTIYQAPTLDQVISRILNNSVLQSLKGILWEAMKLEETGDSPLIRDIARNAILQAAILAKVDTKNVVWP